MATNRNAHEIYWLLLLGSPAELERLLNSSERPSRLYFTLYANGRKPGEGTDNSDTHCAQALSWMLLTLYEIYYHFILDMRKQQG